MQIITNKEEWNKVLEEEFTQFNDVYFRYEYLELWGKHYGGEPEAIFWEDENVKIFWTHLVRDVSRINLNYDFNSELYDLTTPYGYGGPLIVPKTETTKGVKKSVFLFLEYEKRNQKSEFIRFHTVYKQWKYFQGATFFNPKYINDVVFIDLTQDLSTICKHIKKGHRYNIRKAIERGCKINFERNPQEPQISNFIKLYSQTMERNKASYRYYFTTEFIANHFKLLNALLLEAKMNDIVIASSIFLLGNTIIHYHLSGSDYNFRNLYPSDLMLWEAITWAKTNGFELLHLGGGRGKNDSLFDFKKAFSNTTLPFYIGKNIGGGIDFDKI